MKRGRKPKVIQETDLMEAVQTSQTFAEVRRKVGLSDNGKANKKLRSMLTGIDIRNLTKQPRKFRIVVKQCPICNKSFETQAGAKKEKECCSVACALRLRGPQSEATKLKKRIIMQSKPPSAWPPSARKVKLELRVKTCPVCCVAFETKVKRQLFCSVSCASKDVQNRPEVKILQLRRVRRLIAEGKHKGWVKRGKNLRSYPEKFFEQVLNNENIKFQQEKKVGPFFIDFALAPKCALEIDGRQHLAPARQERDRIKDQFLTTHGWTVYRIAWNSINSKAGASMMQDKIAKFLKFYRSIAQCLERAPWEREAAS